MATLPTIVQGNSFALAIPLKVYVIGEGEVVLVDYTPDEGDSITVQLRGNRRVYSYTPTTSGSIATIQVAGNELAGLYDTVVTIIKDDDTHLRAFKSGQLAIVESVDDITEGARADGINAGAIYLDPQIFIRGEQGEDGRGIVSIVKTATTGLVDTYTITYTDGTTSTFTVTNGADGQTPDMSQYALKSDLAAKADLNGNGNEDFAAASLNASNVVFGGYAAIRGNAPTIELVNTLGNSSVLFPYDKNGTVALTSDITSQLSNYCPIIEDTRSSAVANITGVAPFASLQDGQRIILHVKYTMQNNSTLELTLPDNTTTGAIAMWSSHANAAKNTTFGTIYGDTFWEFIYDSANTKWVMLGQRDTNTTYTAITQAEIDAGTQTGTRVISPQLLCDNFAKVTTLVTVSSTGDVTQALDSGKFYKFGSLDSLTITLTAAAAGMAIYAGKFTASANWSALALPVTVDEAAGNDTIASGKTYEFNIVDNVIVVKEV